jgi:hypothetical protein
LIYYLHITYEFGNYEELDNKGREMLKKASEIEHTNPIYGMAYLGSQVLNEKGQRLYEKTFTQSQPILKTAYCGKGF